MYNNFHVLFCDCKIQKLWYKRIKLKFKKWKKNCPTFYEGTVQPNVFLFVTIFLRFLVCVLMYLFPILIVISVLFHFGICTRRIYLSDDLSVVLFRLEAFLHSKRQCWQQADCVWFWSPPNQVFHWKMSVKSESINEQVNGKSSKKITTKVSKTKMKRIKQNGDIDKVAICNGDTKARTVNGNTESSCPNGSANKASTKKKVPDVELIIESKRIRIPKSRDADLSAAKQIMKSSSSLSYNRKNPFDLVECQPFPLKVF